MSNIDDLRKAWTGNLRSTDSALDRQFDSAIRKIQADAWDEGDEDRRVATLFSTVAGANPYRSNDTEAQQ